MRLRDKVSKIGYKVVKSIAFYPTMIATGFFIFAILVISLEAIGVLDPIKNLFPWLIIDNRNTIRALLTTIVGAIASLMAFSFSMVMLFYTQTINNFSPRVVRGFVTQKGHQFIIGAYIGIVVYCMVLLITVGKADEAIAVLPSFAVFFSLLFGVLALVLFVYFIHSISASVQIDNVLKGLYKKTVKSIREGGKIKSFGKDVLASKETSVEIDSWYPVLANECGFLRQIDVDELAKIAVENGIVVKVLAKFGGFVMKGGEFLLISKKIDLKLADEMQSYFIFLEGELISDHHKYGFKHISEVGVKALSPGINDPNTARMAINYLKALLIERLIHREKNFIIYKDKLSLILPDEKFEDLLINSINPIKTYGAGDVAVVIELLIAVSDIFGEILRDAELGGGNVVIKLMVEIIKAADQKLELDFDRQLVNKQITQIKQKFGLRLVTLK